MLLQQRGPNMKMSVVIPTRERAAYLAYSIRTALNIQDDDIEIVVCDNASQDGTAEVVAQFNDARLVYINTDTRLSMRENFNFALQASSGDYVTFFGDDDGILPVQFKFLRRIIEKHKPDGVSWKRATYGWPVAGYGKKTGGLRIYRNGVFGPELIYDPKERNLSGLMDCRINYVHAVTPNLYHGCVSRAYLDKIAPSRDIYFDSSIPDVNFEYRSILTGGRFIHTDHPFSINGYSPASTGGAHNMRRKDKDGGDAGRAFTAENRKDPLQDAFDHALTVPMAFFSTLETVIGRMGYEDTRPNYEEWYRYGMSAARDDPETLKAVQSILSDYAKAHGTYDEFEAAMSMARKPKRTLKERLGRIGDQLNSFRVSTELGGENTILTAVQVYDQILGTEFGEILSRAISQRSAWKAALRRSKSFERQL